MWSSGTNLDRWVVLDRVGGVPFERRAEYDCEFPMTVAERPFKALAGPSFAMVRGTTRRASGGDGAPFCSNLFFISLTLARAMLGAAALPVTDRSLAWASPLATLSSTGFEAERYMGLVAVRGPVLGAVVVGVPLLVDREGGVWRLFETGAIGS